MYFLMKLIMKKHKHIFLMEPQVSKCGFHISNTKKGQVLYQKCTKFHKYIKGKF